MMSFNLKGIVVNLKDHIATIPDFPKPGILFYDISTLLAHAEAWDFAVKQLAAKLADTKPDLVVGIESRGFLIGVPLAMTLGVGLVMVRKAGKLPGAVISQSYDLEYGSDQLQVRADIMKPKMRVVIVDDILATGGTMAAAIALCRKVGTDIVGAGCLLELVALQGKAKFDVPFSSLVQY